MERRQFLGASLALGATACATGNPAPAGLQPRTGLPTKLSSNENPLGLAPSARRALLEHIGECSRYPRAVTRQALTEAIAAKHGLAPEQVQLGSGSTEILQIIVQSSAADTTVVVANPTFEDMARYSAASGRRLVQVPVRSDASHDIGAMRAAAGSGPSLVFICNPNNPTGTLTSCDEVDVWIRGAGEQTTFIVDEAYFEFVEDARYRTAIPWIATQPNVIVVRTFSKICGMAGLRLGYALGQPATIARIRPMAMQNNATELAMVAGLAAMQDTQFQQRTLDTNRASRAILLPVLDELGLTHLPSHTNFVMHRINGELQPYIDRMREAGFLVGRPFPPMLDHSRVSLGLPDDMRRFVATLRSFRAQGRV